MRSCLSRLAYISSPPILQVRVWSWDNPEHTLKVEVPAFSGKIVDLDWDPESKRIVVVGDGKQTSAKCFMWDTGNSVGEMIGHSKRITTCSYKPSRPFRIMTGGEDFKTCWYAGPPFKIDHTNADHTKEVWCVRFSPDGSKLASVGADRRIVFYDSKVLQLSTVFLVLFSFFLFLSLSLSRWPSCCALV